MFILLAIILFAGVLKWDVDSDYKKWLSNVPVQHSKEALIRIALLLPVFILLLLPIVIDTQIWSWHTIYSSIVVGGLMFSVWWELFDGWYNLKRGLSWRSNGSLDPDDSKLDKLLHKLPPKTEPILKLGLITLFLTLYIVI